MGPPKLKAEYKAGMQEESCAYCKTVKVSGSTQAALSCSGLISSHMSCSLKLVTLSAISVIYKIHKIYVYFNQSSCLHRSCNGSHFTHSICAICAIHDVTVPGGPPSACCGRTLEQAHASLGPWWVLCLFWLSLLFPPLFSFFRSSERSLLYEYLRCESNVECRVLVRHSAHRSDQRERSCLRINSLTSVYIWSLSVSLCESETKCFLQSTVRVYFGQKT